MSKKNDAADLVNRALNPLGGDYVDHRTDKSGNSHIQWGNTPGVYGGDHGHAIRNKYGEPFYLRDRNGNEYYKGKKNSSDK